jgi:hypothetical protein
MAAKPAIVEFWTVYGPIITGGAVIVSAITAVCVLFANRAIARRRATLDLIFHIQKDNDLIEARKTFVEVQKGTIKPGHYGTDEQRTSKQALAIRTVLNIHELTAVSIEEGVIEERVFRKWFNKTYFDDFETMRDFINAVRAHRNNNAIFKEFEAVAKKWKTDTAFYNNPSWLGRKWRALMAVRRA